MSGQDTLTMEAEVARLARELEAEIETLCKDLDPDDPEVKKLRADVANISRNIEAARELSNDDPILEKMRARQRDPIYSWEHLPVYAWNNELARVIGKMLATLPKRSHVHIHNLAAQATLIGHCIVMTNREMPPGEVAPAEEVRAYRMIGLHATFTLEEILKDVSGVTKQCKQEIAQGLSLVGKIRDHFESALGEARGSLQVLH